MLPYEDPGWRSSFRVLIPFVGLQLIQKHPRAQVETTRARFLVFVTAWLLFAWVLWFIELEADDPLSDAVAAGIVIAVGMGSIVGALLLIPPLSCASPVALVTSFHTRLFLRLLSAEVPVIVGFVLAFQVGSIWPYLLAAPFALVGFVRAAPTTGSFTRDVADLQARPCAHAEDLWGLFEPSDAP